MRTWTGVLASSSFCTYTLSPANNQPGLALHSGGPNPGLFSAQEGGQWLALVMGGAGCAQRPAVISVFRESLK